MAHIFKHPEAGQKGIISLTHKEVRMLYQEHPYFQRPEGRLKRLMRVVPKRTQTEVMERYRKEVEAIRKHYFIGVHFGWLHEQFPTLGAIDFYLGGTGTVTFAEPDRVCFIPLDGSNFIPDCFHLEEPKGHHKEWDIIMVSRDVRWKNLDKFMHSIRKLYDQGKRHRVLLIVPSNHLPEKDSDPRVTYTELLSDYEKLFSYEERGLFSIIKTHPNMPFLGMAQAQIAKFYHLSKVFTLFSETEGGSRVISEGLLAGLPVVVKSDLKGGGRDLLHEGNAVFFDRFEDAHLALDKAVEQWQTLNTSTEAVKKVAHEAESLKVLASHFEKLYAAHGQKFDGRLINEDWLSFRINGHWHEGLPWASDGARDADIQSDAQWQSFLNSLQL